MNTEKGLFVHDNRYFIEEGILPVETETIAYGEGWQGMSIHISDMTQLDRIIFEDCTMAYGEVVAPHPITSTCPYYLRPETISFQLDCSINEAANLADCWSIIEATPEMVKTFISWVKTRTIEKALIYFEKLATELAQCEAPEFEENEQYSGNTIAYHRIGKEAEVTSWLERQSSKFRALITRVHSASREQLKQIGSEVYNQTVSLKLTHDQTSVFWSEYNMRKRKLLKQVRLGNTTQGILKRIKDAGNNLGAIGAFLYKAQKKQVKLSDPPGEAEWTTIWEAYRLKKAA